MDHRHRPPASDPDTPGGAVRGQASRPAPQRIVVRLRAVLSAPSALPTAVVAITVFLVGFGLVMVLSSSSIASHTDGNSFFTRFSSQAVSAALGLVLMLLVARSPRRLWAHGAVGMLALSCFLQLLALVTPLGVRIGDNTNWIRLGPFTGQPSEGIKIALVVWLGIALGRRQDELREGRALTLRIAPVAGSALLLVLLGGDLGTTVVMAAFTLGAMFFAGARVRHLTALVGAGALIAVLVAVSSTTRRGRISAFFGGESAANPDVHWQLNNAYYALASGGVFGVGVGNSHAKWLWLPSADTDFIFAVIGEELGLIGAGLTVLLFALLAAALIRVMLTAEDPVARVTTGTVLVWLIGQAFINIAVVLGLLPVLGVPLPFISAGGTAMISSLMAIGVVLAFTRRPDGASRRSRERGAAATEPARRRTWWND